MMDGFSFYTFTMIIIFIIGYAFIALEYKTHINKATIALLMAIIVSILQFASTPGEYDGNIVSFGEHLSDISQVIFFIVGALTVVEIISVHQGFRIISEAVKTNSRKILLWSLCWIAFFLSSVLDNLTTTIVMVSLLQKLMPKDEDRLIIGGGIVIAANAGGAWTPIGDVTTTMLWIGGQISTFAVMKSLFAPSIVCLTGSLIPLTFMLSKQPVRSGEKAIEPPIEPMGHFIFFLGIGLLIFVPVFKAMTGLPPFMGMLFAMSILWIITDLIHHEYEDRLHLRVPHVLTRIDISGVLFFLGILLCVNELDDQGILEGLAKWLDSHISNMPLIAICIGLASAIIDNIPLVAASMGMYSLDRFPMDSSFWHQIAYCAGTGGSILVIGSAAGVVYMGMEKVDFSWYFKRIAFPALVGFFAGIGSAVLLAS